MVWDYMVNFWYDVKYSVIDRMFAFLGYEPILPEPDRSDLLIYDEDNPAFVEITKIVVPREEDKVQLILVSKYLHDLPCIDTDIQGINSIVHLYGNPDLIEVINSDVLV